MPSVFLGIAGTFGQALVLQLDLEVDPSPGWRLQCTADRYQPGCPATAVLRTVPAGPALLPRGNAC